MFIKSMKLVCKIVFLAVYLLYVQRYDACPFKTRSL